MIGMHHIMKSYIFAFNDQWEDVTILQSKKIIEIWGF